MCVCVRVQMCVCVCVCVCVWACACVCLSVATNNWSLNLADPCLPAFSLQADNSMRRPRGLPGGMEGVDCGFYSRPGKDKLPFRFAFGVYPCFLVEWLKKRGGGLQPAHHPPMGGLSGSVLWTHEGPGPSLMVIPPDLSEPFPPQCDFDLSIDCPL